MKIFGYIKNTFKNNTNVKGWLSWDAVKENGRTIGELAKGLTDQKSSGDGYVATDFEAAVKHYGLSEADLKQKMSVHLKAALFSAALGLVALGFTVFWLVHLVFLTALASFALGFLMFAYAFREHFSYFIIKQRRLNCTVKEWLVSLIPSKRK